MIRAFDGEADGGESLTLSVAVLGLLCDVARDLPVLCCVDDAHWLDPASLDILAFVARRVGTERIAIVFAGCEGGGRRPNWCRTCQYPVRPGSTTTPAARCWPTWCPRAGR